MRWYIVTHRQLNTGGHSKLTEDVERHILQQVLALLDELVEVLWQYPSPTQISVVILDKRGRDTSLDKHVHQCALIKLPRRASMRGEWHDKVYL